ncbi:hypothetical protein MSG28_016036 [Choristoneura fumiferana]|uniref:Uncharacterized protein n=1 Tax=Choristoneura fumiferana TaxID=7141 RepID=A0ACC0K574_CHOFU|nr:hypothetical protein MSG28_016036 [Choristoneura fumiferana]
MERPFTVSHMLIARAWVQLSDYRVLALDPALPGWITNDNKFRANDGAYTEVIHTNAGLLGYITNLGHTDFYPNGGINMPGCNSQQCDHDRCFYYLAESLRTGGFTGTRCATYAGAMTGNCVLWVWLLTLTLGAALAPAPWYSLRYQRQVENPELSQNFQAPYEQLNNCADPADRQAFKDIPGDGNCFFFSIIKLLDLSITPSQIRKQLLASPLVNSCLNPDGVRSILSSETDYAEMDCIDIFSKVYDKNVCIHYRYVNTATQMEEVQYCHFRVNASQSFLHLHLQDAHYTPLIEI